MNDNTAMSLTRADELLTDLLAEYDRSLASKEVSARAVHLTHEVCERLRSVFDRVAHRYWKLRVAPALTAEDRRAASVYFPIATDRNGFDSTLGRWRWRTVRVDHQNLYDFLLDLQPFMKPTNQWLAILNDLAVQGKHIDLVPQTRTEVRRTTVTGVGGSVSWGPSVIFGPGVRVVGTPIDPATQRVVPTPGVSEKIETWVNFVIQGHGVNAAGFCREACRDTRLITTQMLDKFGL